MEENRLRRESRGLRTVVRQYATATWREIGVRKGLRKASSGSLVSWVDARRRTYTDTGEIGISVAPESAADRIFTFVDEGVVE